MPRIRWAGAAALVAAFAAQAARAETFLGHSFETRLQLDFQIADALVRKALPAGWEPDVATSGGAKDCNIRIQFVDRVDVTDAKDAAQGSSQLVYLEVPVKKTGTDLAGRMVIGGLTTDPKDAPGPFGVYQLATAHKMTRATTAVTGKPAEFAEDWDFAAADGSHIELHLKFERGVARRGVGEIKMFSAKRPETYTLVKNAQGLDPMRNATVTPPRDLVSEFSYKASGGMLAPFFDGKERVISVDTIQWNTRALYQP